jgi:hypothetical protein
VTIRSNANVGVAVDCQRQHAITMDCNVPWNGYSLGLGWPPAGQPLTPTQVEQHRI